MADAPAPPRGGNGFGARMSRKVGPLPVWAWAVILLVGGYFLYKRFGTGSTAATGATPAAATTSATPIPSSDQSGAGSGATSGSTGTTAADVANGINESPGGTLPRVGEASGGGTSSGLGGRGETGTGGSGGGFGVPISYGVNDYVPVSNRAGSATYFGAPPASGFKAV